jgi:virulence-associated protein VagC
MDIFDHTVLCKTCSRPLQKGYLIKNGFKMRTLVCPNGHERIIHPQDQEEYKKFVDLRQKEFKVKMRIVGNSYAVSIPKEIVSFMQEQSEILNSMVKLCFEDAGKLSLTFDKILGEEYGKGK